MEKTYIEFFDKPDIENIMPCLADMPDRVIFLGKNCKAMRKRIEKYEKVICDRGHSVEFICKEISQGNLEKNVQLISEIVDTYENCSFYIDGGEEILTLALGVVFERRKDKKIFIHKYNAHLKEFYDCDNDGEAQKIEPPILSVSENIRIYGGEVIIDEGVGAIGNWNLTADFIDDIEKIWDISKRDFSAWNSQSGAFGRLEGNKNPDYPLVSIGSSQNFAENSQIVTALLNAGLITEYDRNNKNTRVVYKNQQVKECLLKAGLALELKLFVTLKSMKDLNGSLVYNDAVNGVVIDWDGEVHSANEKKYDTTNEIDVMAMHGFVPVFISCKNGSFTADELYKLNTVAERFGGEYAKKILVTTQLDNMGRGGKYIEQRAQDMKIKIIEINENISDMEFESKFKCLWN